MISFSRKVLSFSIFVTNQKVSVLYSIFIVKMSLFIPKDLHIPKQNIYFLQLVVSATLSTIDYKTKNILVPPAQKYLKFHGAGSPSYVMCK